MPRFNAEILAELFSQTEEILRKKGIKRNNGKVAGDCPEDMGIDIIDSGPLSVVHKTTIKIRTRGKIREIVRFE